MSPNETQTQSTQRAFSPVFNHHLDAPSPEFLYHYTTADGLMGIVQTSTLWATRIHYLNDSTEFRGASDMLKERLKQEFDFNDTSVDINTLPRRKQVALWLWQVTQNRHSGGMHVICFCASGDILSQWRGYSAVSYGYSLGFKTETLATFAEKAGFVLGKCIYQKEVQKVIIEEMCNHCLDSSGSKHDILREMVNALLQCGAFFKDSSFAEENEWRLVSGTPDLSEIKFRRGKSMIIPYITLPVGMEATSSINHVYVGPCPHMKLSQDSIWMMLGQKGIAGDVHCSTIPFRDW
jgi:Protein of unknown function (DUF2971)